MNKANRSDVIAFYHALLQRSPESENAITQHLKDKPTVDILLQRFLNAPECFRSVINRRAGDQSFHYSEKHVVEVDGTPEELDQLFDHVRQTWTSLGANNPHFSVLTNPLYHRDSLNPEAEEDFYKTGAIEVGVFLSVCERNRIEPNFSGAAIELGCGVGRIAEPLAAHFHKYLGADISAPHLALARERAQRVGLKNVEYVLLSDLLESNSTYDLFFSSIVLQHNPPLVIAYLLDHMLKRLKPGGLGFFQIPSVLFDYNFILKKYLRGVNENKHMEMHPLPQNKVFEIIANNDCQMLEAIFDGKAASQGFSYTYFCKKI
jgi:SAM-dependent methyltransferase